MSIWYEGLELGIAAIDEQHRALLERMESFLEACIEGQASRDLSKILVFLDEWSRTHFQTEEELMQRYEYPSYQLHKKQHEIFLRNLELVKRNVLQNGGTANTALQVSQMLIDWFRDHILNVDRTAVDFLIPRIS